ncbi:spinster family MFS transporter [Gordonia sp. VNK21]|uniref:spinster family MFS transporter n=1 Tax=Gordonia sp. VNK21 TaxID=3382483 RepID=UPI0038D4500C
MTPTTALSDTAGRSGLQAPNAGRVLTLLAAVNTINFYDRALPAILIEPVKDEFGLSDTQVGVVSASFIVVYAVAGIWLGRLADTHRRQVIMGVGLIIWSLFTALSAGVWSFTSLLLVRFGVGIGESAYGPAANSLIADLYPAAKRSRAVAVLQFGIPLGTILAFVTTGAIMDAFGTWRAPFLVAAIPGLILALFLLRIREPERGAADTAEMAAAEQSADDDPRSAWRRVLSVPTMRWLVLSGVGVQVAAYGLTTFVVPLLQRYYDLELTTAALYSGIIVGAAALLGLVVGGIVSDRMSRRSASGRILVGAVSLLISVPLAYAGFTLRPDQLALFVVLLSAVSFLQYFFHTSALPAVADVNPARLRASAVAIFFAAFYLLGGALGPVLTGMLSDALEASGHGVNADAYGLHRALLFVLPAALLIAALGLFGAARTVDRDRARISARAE